jgi:hypothetical protein
MTRALVYKEFRETAGIAAIGLVLLLLLVAGQIGFSPLPFTTNYLGRIPFVSDSFGGQFLLIAGGLALALGFRQSIGDFLGDAQLFFLHRPVSRGKIYLAKVMVGLGIFLASGMTPILLYAGWAATPGTHASPFVWSMTSASWVSWLALTAVYLGALLSGIRPAAWFGTRLAPLIAAVAAALLLSYCWFAVALAFVIAADALLIYLILAVAQSRDFA